MPIADQLLNDGKLAEILIERYDLDRKRAASMELLIKSFLRNAQRKYGEPSSPLEVFLAKEKSIQVDDEPGIQLGDSVITGKLTDYLLTRLHNALLWESNSARVDPAAALDYRALATDAVLYDSETRLEAKYAQLDIELEQINLSIDARDTGRLVALAKHLADAGQVETIDGAGYSERKNGAMWSAAIAVALKIVEKLQTQERTKLGVKGTLLAPLDELKVPPGSPRTMVRDLGVHEVTRDAAFGLAFSFFAATELMYDKDRTMFEAMRNLQDGHVGAGMGLYRASIISRTNAFLIFISHYRAPPLMAFTRETYAEHIDLREVPHNIFQLACGGMSDWYAQKYSALGEVLNFVTDNYVGPGVVDHTEVCSRLSSLMARQR